MNTIASQQSRRCRVLGALAAMYLALAGAVVWRWLHTSGVEVGVLEAVGCALPALLGVVLAGTSTDDQRQYVARVLAGMMFTPALLLFWATSLDPAVPDPERAVWPFAVSACVGHVLVFLAVIFLGGTMMTAVPPAPGAPAVSGAALRARLLSLQGVVPRLEAAADGTDGIVFTFHLDAENRRLHHVMLQTDEPKRSVIVREKLAVSGARPITREEASMRGIGETSYDPTRPNAQRIYGTTFQTTMIEPARLTAVPVRFGPRGVDLPTEFVTKLDGEGVVTLLCALVIGSGWRWQPVFWGGKKS